jgi:hypothetical protein
MRLPSLFAVALVACAPHGPAAEGRALALPSVIVARPPRAMPGCMKGPRTAIPFFDRAEGLPCDALPRHALGRPSELDGRRVLLDEAAIALADPLARCKP